MTRGRPIGNSFRDKSPCMDCTERFITCQDRYPKDARGEYGYAAWKQAAAKVDKNRKAYYDNLWQYCDHRRSGHG